MPSRSGTPSTRSTPFGCSRKISSMVSGRSSRTPSTSPPREITDMIRATERALPCPLAAPMSAFRQPGVLASSASRTGPVKVLTAGLSMPRAAQVERQRRRRDHVGDPAPVAFGGADLEVGAERSGDLVGDELLQRLAADPADDLADQVPEVERVVARRGARLPPRRLGRHPGGGLLPVVQVLDHGGLVEPGNPGGVRQQVPDQDVLLAAGGELRPVARHRGVDVQLRRGRPASARPGWSRSWWWTRRW